MASKPAPKRKRPPTVCPRCEGMMQRKTAIREKVGARYWGDIEANLNLGDEDIFHFLCRECGNVSAYQLYFDKPW